jgi:methyl-accepting chemotaxis protein
MVLLASKVAAGDYNCRVGSKSNTPQIQVLSKTINKMLDSISGSIDKSNKVLSEYGKKNYDARIESSELTGQMKKMLDGVNNLGDSLKEFEDQNKQSAGMLEERAQELGLAINTLKKTTFKELSHIVEGTTDRIMEASQKQNELADNLARLSSDAEQVKGILTVISDIADQTNLLALNAAIEAARAGEAGKGFAVVADEIGKLAANSAEAAEQIQKVSAAVVEAVNGLALAAENMVEFAGITAVDGYQQLVEMSEFYSKDAGDMNAIMEDLHETDSI